jgi:prevent-host-death family protein
MPTRTCGAEQARTQLPMLLERAHRGSATIITRHGKPYAALVPVGALASRRRPASLLTLRGSGAGLWGDDPARTIDALREEWT